MNPRPKNGVCSGLIRGGVIISPSLIILITLMVDGILMEMMQIKIIDINLVRRLGGIVHTLSKERAEDLINSGKAILIKTIKEKEIKEELDENGEVILEKTTWNIGDSIFPDFLFSVVG